MAGLSRLVTSVKLILDIRCWEEGLSECQLIEVCKGQERKCCKQCVCVNANRANPSLETVGSTALVFTRGSGGQFKALLVVNLWTSAAIKQRATPSNKL